ncbi:hypothetical protein BGZ47_010559 [Haplosporangium gracile]|nr:hypothetical protein BGZ47_010559 [Haplosporangium gracile]
MSFELVAAYSPPQFAKGMALAAALDSGTVIRLHSLPLRLTMSSWSIGNLYGDEGWSTGRISTMMEAGSIEIGGHQLNDLVPISAFNPRQAQGVRMDMTKAHGQLVLMNPGLSRLLFRAPGVYQFVVDKNKAGGGSLTLASQSSLVNTFSRLLAIRYLELGMNAVKFVIHNLNTLLPNLVHTDKADFDLEML